MTTERFAVIDMGTNTFHLLLAERKGSNVRVISKEKVSVKIGEKGINIGYITPDACDRAVHALLRFRVMLERYPDTIVFAAATSAMRNASNGNDLADRIFATTGIKVNIITGEKEAELIFEGVRHSMDLGSEHSLIMDIGGGSVEFVICNQQEIFWKKSFEIGGQRLLELFHQLDPIRQQDIDAEINFLDDKLWPLYEATALWNPKVLVGSSGSFDTLASMDLRKKGSDVEIENEKEYHLEVRDFYTLYEEVKLKNKVQRLAIPGMIEMRVDMIVVASVLISRVIEKLELKKIRVSTFALKEGILSNLLNNIDIL